uniref:Poly [ADP-ribose] polymerase n=1 Tax=Oryzias latipes TaxID=8090 RepID=A0A3P9IVG1_ORYLA
MVKHLSGRPLQRIKNTFFQQFYYHYCFYFIENITFVIFAIVVSSPSLGVYHMQLGQLTLEVSSGDITKESCDVIVNSTNPTFNLYAGVSKAILDCAGGEVQRECDQIVQSSPHKRIVMTNAGQLPCTKIIHVLGHNDPANIKSRVFDVLRYCEDKRLSSIAFPALGTGLYQTHTHISHQSLSIEMGHCKYDCLQDHEKKTGSIMLSLFIERVQNITLWKSYEFLKKQMEQKNNHKNNERVLFHGTSANSIDLINNKGFNRSYAGLHAAAFGKGSYFAVDPAYSAQGYAKPDNQGHKRMYQARVLVGDFTQGNSGLIVPPSKSGQSADLYDSVTDNKNPPSMFVVFNDIQAFPEYLITFT